MLVQLASQWGEISGVIKTSAELQQHWRLSSTTMRAWRPHINYLINSVIEIFLEIVVTY